MGESSSKRLSPPLTWRLLNTFSAGYANTANIKNSIIAGNLNPAVRLRACACVCVCIRVIKTLFFKIQIMEIYKMFLAKNDIFFLPNVK